MFEQRFKYFFTNNKRNKEFIIQAVGVIKDSSKTETSKMLDNLAEPLIEFDDNYKTDHLDWAAKECLNQNSTVSPSAPKHVMSTSSASSGNSASLSLSATNSISYTEHTDDDDDEGFDEDPLECGVHVKTKNSGFLSGQFSVPHDNILNWAQEQNQYNARLIQIQSICTDGNKFSRNHGIVNLIEPTGISVISDIDDTIKDTKILSGARAVLSKTFFEEPQSVQGMAEAYNYWVITTVFFLPCKTLFTD
jgi:phosphatidate phosphatase APP1